MATPLIFNYDTTCFTTSSIASTPIVCATPTPSFSPKRKYTRCDSGDADTLSYTAKRRRLSTTSSNTSTISCGDDSIVAPTTPLYLNFGNGISLCNNTKTKTNNLSIDEILHFLTEDDTTTKTTSSNHQTTLRNSTTACDDIVNELMVEVSRKDVLPELSNVLLDLRDTLRPELNDFLL